MRDAVQVLRSVDDIRVMLAKDASFMTMLSTVVVLGLPDCWIGAGAVRNRIWDCLHGLGPRCSEETDVDVIFHDEADVSVEREAAFEKLLSGQMTGLDWQVRNQARMHLGNGDAAYRDCADAMRHWPETATAIAARLENGRIELLAPFGFDDVLDLVVRPTPAFLNKQDLFRARQAAKNWRARWPLLNFAV